MHVPWSGAGHYALFMRQAIAPVGESRNDMDICADLAGRLGIEGYNDKTEEAWLRDFCAGTEIHDFEAFLEQGLARLPAPDDAVAFAQEVADPEHHPFSTPSGKIEVYSTTIAANPDYGRIVCHCERVTRGEIIDATGATVPARSLDGVRRRTRALLGRCQGFYCSAAVAALLAETTGRRVASIVGDA